jgi:hypothetical protein
MLVDGNAFSFVELAIGISCLFLGVYILWKKPYLKVSQTFLVSMCMVAITTAFSFLLQNAQDEFTANLFGIGVMISDILVAVSFVLLVMYLPYEQQAAWPITRKYRFGAMVLILATVVAILPGSFVSSPSGFQPAPSIQVAAWFVAVGGLSMMAVYFLNRSSESTDDHRIRWECAVLTVAVLLPFMATILIGVLIWAGLELTSSPAVGSLIAGLIFAKAVLAVEPFEAPALKHKEVPEGAVKPVKVNLASGHCDLIMSKRADEAYRMFQSELKGGSKGLLITRVHPDQLKEAYGPIDAPILWLSSQPGQDRLDPAALTIIQHTMIEFIQKWPKAIVMLDGLDYLISENQLDKVLRMIYAVHDTVVVSGSKFIVPMDPQTMEMKELAFIEREFVVVNIEQAVKKAEAI